MLSNRKIYELAMSGDGSRVPFKLALTYYQSTDQVCWKHYVVNADGTNLVDIPPPDVSPVTCLRMNQDGSRLFFHSPVILRFLGASGSGNNLLFVSLLPRGAVVETDIGVAMTPVDVFGILYDVSLKPWRKPLDPFVFYWTPGAYSRHFE